MDEERRMAEWTNGRMDADYSQRNEIHRDGGAAFAREKCRIATTLEAAAGGGDFWQSDHSAGLKLPKGRHQTAQQ
ncbi:hypothetical protein I7I50_06749 [Histoplasma capsulatum G186AR]|uniref:Uncharacterized protein n=1 Tax=Ajellomyces capsulatus TaxID=5037 RepID=A0A8H7Z256_AJECA|nr:hypothetical protein I7I52_10177 [Histoplasma capsulatum]QSS67615.1 hypothetical protein I7I50_06749 [Histoplasma capsulatum G186AR]